MHKLTGGLLIFILGWGLGWYTHNHWGIDPIQTAQTVIPASSNTVNPDDSAAAHRPTVPAHVDSIMNLLVRNEFEAVVERYDLLQTQADDVEVADARVQILSHARQLITDRHFRLAEQLLKLFLVAAYRDVEAQTLLSETVRGQGNLHAAIDLLYEARGNAYRPVILKQLTERIRTVVGELSQSLSDKNDQKALLALYQHLTQLEPDYAPYFMGLAATQLAIDDKEAARRSLLLVSNDPDVGAQAQVMLAELNAALAETQDTQPQISVMEVVGIPLQRSGNHFIVDAKPAYGRSIRLLIDTGASLTILTPDVLEQHGIRYKDTGRSGLFNTANGQIQAPIYKLDALTVGDWQVDQLEVGILELNSSSGIDGLLGMNFLRHFQFFIDQNEALLRLSVN